MYHPRGTFIDLVLPLVDGLQLDNLTIRYTDYGYSGGETSHMNFNGPLHDFELDRLIRYGRGWKELLYYVPDFSILQPMYGHSASDGTYCVTDAPHRWAKLLKEQETSESTKDGSDGSDGGDGGDGATVNVYVVQQQQNGNMLPQAASIRYAPFQPSIANPGLYEHKLASISTSNSVSGMLHHYHDVGTLVSVKRAEHARYVQDRTQLHYATKEVFSMVGWGGVVLGGERHLQGGDEYVTRWKEVLEMSRGGVIGNHLIKSSDGVFWLGYLERW